MSRAQKWRTKPKDTQYAERGGRRPPTSPLRPCVPTGSLEGRFNVDVTRDDRGLEVVESRSGARPAPSTRSRGTARGRRRRSRACRRTASRVELAVARSEHGLIRTDVDALEDRGEEEVGDRRVGLGHVCVDADQRNVAAGIADGRGSRLVDRAADRQEHVGVLVDERLSRLASDVVRLEATGELAVLCSAVPPKTVTSVPFSELW